MRKAITISIFLFSLVSALSASRVLDSETKVISAYKLGVTELVQEQVLTLRMMDINNAEFDEAEIVVTPLDARNSDYPAFFWVLGGNIYRTVTISFTFGPMWQEGNSSSNKYIPYTMKLEHVSSKVGNSVLACNKDSVSLPVSFMGYDFNYADKTTYPNAVTSVTNSSKSATVTYDMGTSYTKVKQNGVTAGYSGSVCSYWTRMGKGTIHLNINENAVPTTGQNATQLPDGMYYANITVTITPNT